MYGLLVYRVCVASFLQTSVPTSQLQISTFVVYCGTRNELNNVCACVCVSVCVRACMRACVRACVFVVYRNVCMYNDAQQNTRPSVTFLIGIESLLEVRAELREANITWFELGLALGLFQHSLKSIQNDDINHSLTETLAAWLQGRDGAAAPTWRAVVKALLSPAMNFYRLALQISNTHPSDCCHFSTLTGCEDPTLQYVDNTKLGKSFSGYSHCFNTGLLLDFCFVTKCMAVQSFISIAISCFSHLADCVKKCHLKATKFNLICFLYR